MFMLYSLYPQNCSKLRYDTPNCYLELEMKKTFPKINICSPNCYLNPQNQNIVPKIRSPKNLHIALFGMS